MLNRRNFDLVLQGATGFTGRLAAKELVERAPAGLSWAIAGRSQQRVEELADHLHVPFLVADGLDPIAVDKLAAQARVVISCAGPFTRYGTLLVDACVRHQTHYADLTGELPWMQGLIAKHHSTCVNSETAIIPAAGFDSVPADTGVYALIHELEQSTPVWGFFTIKGGLNGGTLHSGLALAEDGDLGNHSPGSCFPVPCLKRWAAPFLMAPVNQQVVRRSAALLSAEDQRFGSKFYYQEHLLTANRIRAQGMSAILSLSGVLMSSSVGRKLLRWFGPKPGQGPSERSIRNGFARLILVAGSLDQPIAMRRWDWNGDPSNLITVRSLVQTGLALAAGESRRGGVLTPTSALGARLLERLQAIDAVSSVPIPGN